MTFNYSISQSFKKLNRYHLGLFLILGLAFLIRIYKLDSSSIWFDEKSSLSCALGFPHPGLTIVNQPSWTSLGFENNKPFSNQDFSKFNSINNVLNSSPHSHLYFGLLHYWVSFFGVSDFSIRLLSVIFSCLMVLILYLLAMELFGKQNVALMASFLIAISPICVLSGQFARAHSMVGFLTLWSTLIFYRLYFNKSDNLLYSVLYVVLIIVSLFSHFYSLYIFSGHFFIMLFTNRNWILWKKYFLSNAFVLTTILIYYINGGTEDFKLMAEIDSVFANEVQNWKPGGNPHFMPLSAHTIYAGWLQVLLPMFGNYFQGFGFRLREIQFFLILPLTFLILLYIKRKSTYPGTNLLFVAILFISGPLCAFFFSLRAGYTMFFTPGYSLYSFGFAVLLLALAFAQIKNENGWVKKTLYCLTGIQIVITWLSLIPIYREEHLGMKANPYPVVVDKIVMEANQSDTIIYSSFIIAQTTNIYLKGCDHLIQKVDTAQNNQILIKKANGEKYVVVGFDEALNY
ncbi:MAG: glycosyltransferase family 39 protein [Sphingobacteriaceae bacterium]|nr:glycosyltransferase family 39 protein [Sphingobacteriaceae bacterium]